MKIEHDQLISAADEAFNKAVADGYVNNLSGSVAFKVGFIYGFELIQKEKPQWILFRHNNVDLPKGHYLIRLKNINTGITSEVYYEIKKEKGKIPYIFATHYLEIQVPD